MSPDKASRNLNKLNSVQSDRTRTDTEHSSFNSRNRSLKSNNGLGFVKEREKLRVVPLITEDNTTGKVIPNYKTRFFLSSERMTDVSMDIIVSFPITESKEQTDSNSDLKQVQDANVNPFLDEIKNLVGTVKSMIESQFRMMAPFTGQGFP